jgi:hypothetical protein
VTIVTNSAAKSKLQLDEPQRDWLKRMGAALEVQVGGGVALQGTTVKSITAKPAPSQPTGPVIPSQPAPAKPDTKPRIVAVTVTDKITNNAVPNAYVKVGDQAEKTGNQGTATLSLPPGTHKYSVTASTFVEASGTVEVTSAPETPLRVEMKPTRTTLSLTLSPGNESHFEQDIVMTATVEVGNPLITPLGMVEFTVTYYKKRISLAKVAVKDWKASYTWHLQPVGPCLFDATFVPSPPTTGFQQAQSNVVEYAVRARNQQQTDVARKEYEQAYRETLPIINQGRGVSRSAPALETGYERILQEQREIQDLANGGNYRHAKDKELLLKDKTLPEFLAAADEYVKAIDKYEGCMVTARDFKDLGDARKGLLAQRKKVDQYAVWGNSWWDTKKEAKTLFDLAVNYRRVSDEKQKVYNEKGNKITQALDAAGAAGVAAAARDIVNSELRNDADVKYLPTAVRNRLVEALQRDGSPESIKAVQRIYKVRALDPEFEKEDRKNRDKLVAVLKNDPEMAKARKNWSKMDGNQKFEVIKKIVMHHAEVYGTANAAGVPALDVKPFNQAPVETAEGTSITNGEYFPSTGLLRINTNGKSMAMKSFDEAIDLAVHEAAHRYQNVLKRQVDSGGLPQNSPLANQAKAFSLNTSPNYFTTPAVARNVYENQPKEAHSRISALAVQQGRIGQ